MSEIKDEQNTPMKRTVIDYDKIVKMVPALEGKKKFVNGLLKFLQIDKVNNTHDSFCDTPGPEFVRRMIESFRITMRVDNEDIIANMGDKPFITVSNHPFGALDGIMLIHLLTRYYPEYKVMVNMILGNINAMRPNFIAVDPMASNDPIKKAQTMKGIREAMALVKSGKPIGFFPAGAVSKINKELRIVDREWQPNIIRLIQQLKVPVVPIYFHGHNSTWFNILGVISWQARSLRLPAEVYRRLGDTFHISVGEPISVEEQMKYKSVDELGKFLKGKTYEMRSWK